MILLPVDREECHTEAAPDTDKSHFFTSFHIRSSIISVPDNNKTRNWKLPFKFAMKTATQLGCDYFAGVIFILILQN